MGTWETFIVSLVSGGLAGAIVRYVLDIRRGRREYTLRLHEEWWKPEFQQMRTQIYALVEDFQHPAGPSEEAKRFLTHVADGTVWSHPCWPSFVRISFFFADLNTCLDKGLVDRNLAYRLSGEAQYIWFEPLLEAVRQHIGRKPGVRWVWETESLGKKFSATRARDERRRSALLEK